MAPALEQGGHSAHSSWNKEHIMKTFSTPNSRLLPLSLALLLVSAPALAQWPGTTQPANPPQAQRAPAPQPEGESVNIISSSGWANPSLAQAEAASGQALLSHLRSARAWLVAGSPAGARDALRTAGEFTNAMERSMPFVAVADDVTTARNKLLAGEDELFYDDLLPIYASVDEMQIYTPQLARQVHGKVKKAETQARRGKSREAARTLREVGDEVTHSAVYLPLDYVGNEIQVAKADLKRDHYEPAKAETAINKALNSLIEQQFTVESTPAAQTTGGHQSNAK
jgi:hypothetical protein